MISFIDFEASGLEIPDSYPIEVGVATLDSDLNITSWGTLIRPERPWTHWSEESARIHKISRNELADGERPKYVAQKLNDLYAGQALLCDGGKWDAHWTKRLFENCGYEPRFALQDFMIRLMWLDGLTDRDVENLSKRIVRGKINTAHRAEADARQHAMYFAEAIRICQQRDDAR